MPDDNKAQAETGGTPQAVTPPAPQLSPEQKALVDALKQENVTAWRALQSATDKKVQALEERVSAQLQSLADHVGVSVEALGDVATAGIEDEGERTKARMRVAGVAREGREAMSAHTRAVEYIESTLQAAGLDAVDDLHMSVSAIASKLDKNDFDTMVALAKAKKGPPPQAGDSVAALQAQIADLQKQISAARGEGNVPAGGGAAPGPRVHKGPLDWTPEELAAKRRELREKARG